MTHGPDAIVELIAEDGMTYPVTANRLEREHALANVQIDEAGNSMMVGELLERIDTDRFENETDVRETFEPAFETERERREDSFLDTIKKLLLGTYTG